jgi:serine/threonine protein phosphatase PrpC
MLCRILEWCLLGASISDNGLIDGIIETTRALGNHGDKDLKKCLSNSPYCWTYEIDPSLECIILATEGLWNVLQYDVVVDIVTQVRSVEPIFFVTLVLFCFF